ncbi:MAG: Gfo/Idh/MocA family oxidoreductase [Candidatus Hydrogenedentes bacterium]|nr:Gfo/Idh/MocA family oxidoreductase [Candidatus Hydrogenedentota bacterium]
MMSEEHGMDRRDFFRRAGQGAALAGLGVMVAEAAQASAKRDIVPSDPRAPKTGRLLKDDEIIGIGMIGIGGMGGGHVEELCKMEKDGAKLQIRAVSDVYKRRQVYRQKWVKSAVGRDIDAYTDYRKLLERDDIHAVVIATPDHWHALTSIHAMEAGKDVYCQKPVTLTVEESVQVRDKVLETGHIFQCGAQRTSEDFWWQARSFIKKGGIGKVLWAQADYSRNSAGGPDDRGGEWNWHIDPDATDNPNAGEASIDWQQWLGPAQKRPFSQPRFFQFRKYWDYSGGIATDLLYHVLAPMTIALDAKAPERATGAGGIYVQHDDREVPDTFMITLDYPDDYTVILTSSMANRQANPILIRGHKATIRPEKDGMKVTAEDEFKEWFKKEFGQEEIIVPNQPRPGHMEVWLQAIRTRGDVHLDAETAYRAMAGIKMGVEAYRQDKTIYWDWQKERYVNKHPRPNRSSKVPAEKA